MPDPRYQLIADEIRGRIESGALAPGERVPSTRQIARDWQVAMATATKVLTTLRQQDLVEARPGIGTVVRALHAKKPRKADPTAPHSARTRSSPPPSRWPTPRASPPCPCAASRPRWMSGR
ncbi:GntR family transcriptional regulator [Fodinicola feengrottensis]|uniref:GntR family transcriptional regulator n=1 Tax=Fodinicola feengrottensis TaxID=435914 RepID=UPI0024429A94|nr:winged helix-turn-helix domain-containing protein [Fodinicola feengrottensis]